MAQLADTFPSDISWSVPYDRTLFISESINEVVRTVIEAMVLVFVVMFLFLQNWRATLIPTIVVPIALAGACLGLWLFGFSINVLSLFAMVLAIGILVRSEEHTSELQSLMRTSYAVFCLKKKNNAYLQETLNTT